jgi:hypothetical protein
MLKCLLIVVAIAAIVLPMHSAGAEEVQNRTDYTIALSGLPLANARFQARRDGASYAIDAQIASTGLADFIADTKAEMSSAGEISGGQFRPQKFLFRYKYGKHHRSFETRFQSGNVVSSIVEPKRKKKQRKDWIAVQPEDLIAVTDPVAGLVIPTENQPCRAEIAVYDGESRLNLQLAHKGEQNFRTEGFDGEAIVCSIRYEPKSGYRKGHNDVEYVRKLRGMEIWFAKSAPMAVYAPVFLSVPTKYGTLTITATHFDG